MKLVFPNGEHPQVLLGPGINRIGSDPHANVVLDRPGVMPQHCELHVSPHGVMLQVPRNAFVSVNGRAVAGLISLRTGDRIDFDRVHAQLAKLGTASVFGPGLASANDDIAATAVRPVLPRYVLRGVSGEAFGRSYPLVGPTVVGRAPECNLRLDESGLSRQHARLIPTAQGLQIQDLGSTNGCFVNGKRVQRAQAVPGDEVGFDTLRFRLVAPGQGEPVQVAARTVKPRPPMSRWWWVGLAALGLFATGTLALFW